MASSIGESPPHRIPIISNCDHSSLKFPFKHSNHFWRTGAQARHTSARGHTYYTFDRVDDTCILCWDEIRTTTAAATAANNNNNNDQRIQVRKYTTAATCIVRAYVVHIIWVYYRYCHHYLLLSNVYGADAIQQVFRLHHIVLHVNNICIVFCK